MPTVRRKALGKRRAQVQPYPWDEQCITCCRFLWRKIEGHETPPEDSEVYDCDLCGPGWVVRKDDWRA